MNMHITTSTVNDILYYNETIYKDIFYLYLYNIIYLNLDKNNQNNTSNLSFFREY